ncbi:MAG TPA: MarR family transcriptional regulator [Chloroflexaceae bacterium]|nr:MarR family transcriptional regulator [Chloroflexaceae bacterium]
MPDSTTALQEQMIALIRAFGLHQGDRTPCGKPVSVAEAHALLELSRHGPLPQRDLAAWLRLEKSTVSRLVAQLEQRGWLLRERSAEDKRVLLLALTPEGRRIAGELAASRRARFARLLAALPENEREPVLRALALLVEAIDATV